MSRASKAALLDVLSAFMRAHTFRIKYLALSSQLIIKVARLLRYADQHLQLAALRCLRGVLTGKDEFYLKSLPKPNGGPVFADILACFVRSGGSAGHAQQLLPADEVRPSVTAGNVSSSWFPSFSGSVGRGGNGNGPPDSGARAAPLGAGPASLLRSACLEAFETLAKSGLAALIQQVAVAYKPLLLLVSPHRCIVLTCGPNCRICSCMPPCATCAPAVLADEPSPPSFFFPLLPSLFALAGGAHYLAVCWAARSRSHRLAEGATPHAGVPPEPGPEHKLQVRCRGLRPPHH